MQTYKYDHDTKEFLYSEEAYLDPLETKQQGRDVYLLPADSIFTEPLPAKDGYAVCWNGTAWEYVEDHRQKCDKGGVPIEGTGTAYWLPEDTWESEARYMKELGPLPEGAVTVKPEKPLARQLAEAKAAKRTEIQAGYDAALAASLTMPAAAPTVQDVAVGAALFAVEDAEGLAYVQALHAARRDELLAAVDAAQTVEAVQAIDASYAV